MSDQTSMSGKDAVRVRLIQRLEAAGLKRPKSCKTDEIFERAKRRLVDFLAYLSPASLEALADQLLSYPTGKGRDLWLPELTIRQMAEALERRPPEEAPIVTSWLASVEGPRALAAGYAVEMLRYLRKKRSPLMPYEHRLIAEEAHRAKRMMQLISERQRDGIDREEDKQWLAEYAADLRLVEALVVRGEQVRMTKQAVGAEQ